ncbi:hypothetical protein L6R53_22730 [Myxococcota bacterium]|nr:hypothetical protein [Myxococcota bacterium]
MLLPLLLLACAPGPPASDDSGGAPALWPGEDVRPALEHGFFAAHALPELSLYSWCEEDPDRPDAAHRGPLGVGNGRAFALLGLAAPLNRLHAMTGPTYDKGTRFFGDHWLTLEVDGVEAPFTRECITRPRGTGLVITRADAGDVTLYTVDLAPRLSDAEAPAAIVRHVLVQTDAPHAVRVRHHAWQDLALQDGALVEEIAGERRLAVLGLTDGVVDLGTVQGEAAATLRFAFAEAGQDLPDTAQAEAWTDPTLAWWTDWSATGVQLSSDDPRVEDLYDAQRVLVQVQTTAAGGIAPMSRYTGVWLRDTIGPVRFLLRAGLHDQARAALAYLHQCHAERGDYGNSCTSGLDPTVQVDEPDWAALGAFSGRTAAEGPSYVPLAWLDEAAWTDDRSQVEERWDYLRRGVLAQVIDEEGRQAFSGDETFRLFLNVALGLELEEPWQDVAWSANSSLLMKAAAGRMAREADALGRGEDAALLAARSELADHALRTHFLQEGTWLAPFILHSTLGDLPAGMVAPQPFEDVNLTLTWSDAFDVDDPLATTDLQALLDFAGRGDGTVQSPPAARYAGAELYGVEIEEGVGTGMVPGYALSTFTRLGHPQAAAAFDALHAYAGPTGSFPEALLYDDKSALQVYYDETGGIGDIAARYRPWEGAINLDAMLEYLLGAAPVDGGAHFRPHLPAGHRQLAARGLRAGACVGDLEVEGRDRAAALRFTAAQPCTVTLELPVPTAPRDPGEGSLVTLPGGELLWRAPPQALEAGQAASLALSW